MSFTHADYLAMQARCDQARKNFSRPDAAPLDPNVKEAGKGGIQEQIEEWMKTMTPIIWWDRKRTDVATTSRIGVPDFVGVYKCHSFALEVKRPGQKPTVEQLGELKWMELAGAKTAVVHSLDEAKRFFEGLK